MSRVNNECTVQLAPDSSARDPKTVTHLHRNVEQHASFPFSFSF